MRASNMRASNMRASNMRANVKPFTHWVIYKKYKVRFASRHPQEVTGVLMTPMGEVKFRYEPTRKIVYLPDETITINEYGWEISPDDASE